MGKETFKTKITIKQSSFLVLDNGIIILLKHTTVWQNIVFLFWYFPNGLVRLLEVHAVTKTVY